MSTRTTLIAFLLVVSAMLCSGCQAIQRLAGLEGAYDHRWEEFYDSAYCGDYAKAEELLNELKSSRSQQQSWLLYAEAYLDQCLGRYDQALSTLDRLLQQEYRGDFYYLRGEVLQEMHRLSEARDDFDRARRTGASHMDRVLYNLWTIDMTQGRVEDAEVTYDSLQRLYPNEPSALEAAFRLALMNREFEEAQDAVNRYKRCPAAAAADGEIRSIWDTAVLGLLVELAVAENEIDQAFDFVEQMKSADERRTYYCVWKAWTGISTCRWEEARLGAIEGLMRVAGREMLEQVGVDVPVSLSGLAPSEGPLNHRHSSSFLSYLADVSLAEGDLDLSMACVEKAVDSNSYCPYALLTKVSLLELMGRPEEALESAAEAVGTAPDEYSPAWRYVRLARRYPDLVPTNAPSPELTSEALLQRLQALHERFPEDPTTAYLLARFLDETDHQPTRDLYESAYRFAPYNIDSALNLAESSALAGDLEGAIQLLEAHQMVPYFPGLARMYIRAEEKSSSDLLCLADWVRERMDPDNNWAENLDPFVEDAREACGIESP